jgi:hypothetical protein
VLRLRRRGECAGSLPSHLTAGQNIAAGRAAPGIAWGEPMKISDIMRRTVGNRREVKREQEGG